MKSVSNCGIPPSLSWTLLICLLLACQPKGLRAQEGGGQASVGFEQYYLSIGSQRVANISGLTANYSQFIPDIGLLSANLAPAKSDQAFRSGDDYVRLTGAPWQGQHWNFTVGDFRMPGQLIPVPFTNFYFPDIAARGVLVEAKHSERTVGFFYGRATIANTPRVVLRIAVPQTVFGLYARQQIGSRLTVGFRLMHFSDDIAALKTMPNLLSQSNQFKDVTTIAADALFRVAGPLKFYGEATWSGARTDGVSQGTSEPFSTLAGPLYENRFLRVRANYTVQSAAYFPLVGYYLGDRKGPFAEVTVHPVKGIDLYGSASAYENNVAGNPNSEGFRNTTGSVGAAFQLPGRISVSGQFINLDLWSRSNSAAPWKRSTSEQRMVTSSKTLSHHTFRVTVRDFRQVSDISPQRQQSAEIEEIFHSKYILAGGGVRFQRVQASDSRTTLYYHGLCQLHFGPVSAYADVETGSDLLNRTLLATNSVTTSVIGVSMILGKHWEIQGEAYRNNLVAELNPQSIFVLQGQGVFIPGSVASLNQWSIYFRVIRRFRWGKAGDSQDLTQYAVVRAPLKGSIEGTVTQRIGAGAEPAAGIPVTLDGARTATTDNTGRYRFGDVPEGIHTVALSQDELPADFDPGPNREQRVSVRPDRPTRGDLDVVPLAAISGKVIGPPDVPLDSIVIRMVPGERYTTPDAEGAFNFANLHEGAYTVSIDESSLPKSAVLMSPQAVEAGAKVGEFSEPVTFRFEIHRQEKPVRRVLDEPAPQTLQLAPSRPQSKSGSQNPAPTASDPPIQMTALAAPNTDTQAVATLPATANATSNHEIDTAAAVGHNLKGRALTQSGRFRDAIAELTEAIRIDPTYAQAYNAKAYALYLLHEYPDALTNLDEAIELNPRYVNAFEVRSAVKRAMGDIAGSLMDSRRAKEVQH